MGLNFKTIPRDSNELFFKEYYTACTLGSIVACGPTHSALTPLDLVKCRRQGEYIHTGLGATFMGYSLQGAGKYGFYKYFKTCEDLVGREKAEKFKTRVHLAAAASTEFLADIALCSFRLSNSVVDGWKKITAQEGIAARQIPYTVVKFAVFETVEQIYVYLGKPVSSYTPLQQTGMSFLGGCIAEIFSDVMVWKITSDKKTKETSGGALKRIYGDISFRGIWNGLPVRVVMIGTLTGFQWLVYDSSKVSVGLPTTGSH
ncbi:mitochondrial carrier [Metschnikowia bicuspidata]|uniref:Mitochondrial carrier n=1 Tax=Metschnikowia bicuspidata TaxID=27322 RepID=A0A4P9ZFM7_9ASCO|nr:mitochondrial carrier [Metschnikowia bicuspidata]